MNKPEDRLCGGLSLAGLKSCVDQMVEVAGDSAKDCRVEVWYKKKGYIIKEIGQFGIVGDATITIGEKIFDFTDED